MNDFEYDTKAKEWMPWSFLKNYLEGGSVKVSRPKNRGGNLVVKGDGPVFLTAAQEVTMYRHGREDVYEREQMRARVRYIPLWVPVPEGQRREDPPCGHCGARVYLEGVAGPAAPPVMAAAIPTPSPIPVLGDQASVSAEPHVEPEQKKARTSTDIIKNLQEAVALKDQGVLDAAAFETLKEQILRGD